MIPRVLSDDTARELRQYWFDFLDHFEPHRRDLFRYAARLTGDLFAAEDLVQDTLLRGFAAIGRGDLHGETSRVRDERAYLFRIVSNLWIDGVRRQQMAELHSTELALVDIPLEDHAEAAEADIEGAAARLYAMNSPQERAAIVLKEVFEFTTFEIAELLDTTEGAVKSALHRGRTKLDRQPLTVRHAEPDRNLLSRFVSAFNSRDPKALTACLLDTVSIEVQGVGGGRGHKGVWVESSLRYARGHLEVRSIDGYPVVLHLYNKQSEVLLDYVTRLEMADGRIARIQSYSYCPDLVEAIAAQLKLATVRGPYHQSAETLDRMILTTGLPWGNS
jgi:RNA polymerase sigma-70 factor, ECF subfamily